MSPPLHHIQTSPSPPDSADVVVIGGGIIGVFAAYYMAKRGVSVALVEKGRIGAEQSSRNWGWCRQQNRDARELPMATKSIDLWEQFAAESGWRSLLPGGLEGIRGGHETLARWRLDAPTPMERVRILDPKPDLATVRETHRRAVELLPELRESKITHSWAGFVDSTPDGVPGIGEVEASPGFILAAGFSGHGFGIGPGAGHLIADLATGTEPIVDPVPYRPSRFSSSAWGKVADF